MHIPPDNAPIPPSNEVPTPKGTIGILLDEHPFKDYWIVSGPFLDYFQALFFYLFGV